MLQFWQQHDQASERTAISSKAIFIQPVANHSVHPVTGQLQLIHFIVAKLV